MTDANVSARIDRLERLAHWEDLETRIARLERLAIVAGIAIAIGVGAAVGAYVPGADNSFAAEANSAGRLRSRVNAETG